MRRDLIRAAVIITAAAALVALFGPRGQAQSESDRLYGVAQLFHAAGVGVDAWSARPDPRYREYVGPQRYGYARVVGAGVITSLAAHWLHRKGRTRAAKAILFIFRWGALRRLADRPEVKSMKKLAIYFSAGLVVCFLAIVSISLATTGKLPVVTSGPVPIELDKGEALSLINAEYQAAIAQAEVQKIRAEIYQKRSLTPDKYTLDVRNGRLVPLKVEAEAKK